MKVLLNRMVVPVIERPVSSEIRRIQIIFSKDIGEGAWRVEVEAEILANPDLLLLLPLVYPKLILQLFLTLICQKRKVSI